MLLLAACWTACADGPKPEELEWIRTNAVALETSEAGNGFEDLEPLKALMGDARIVSLGECTHGTREVFQMKHRLVEYLASQRGFTIFSIEANMPEAYRLNAYVLEGKGDPRQLIAGMYFWTWNTEEVLEMVEWMRQFNQSGKGRIEFTGFDMQTPDVAMDIVLDFLKENDPQRLEGAKAIYSKKFRKRPKSAESSVAVATGASAAAKKCGEIVAQMEASRENYVTATSQKEADWAIQNARVVHQYLQLIAQETPRDESMARNVQWILDHAPRDAKIVLWAHNVHVSRQKYRGGNTMGAFLDDWYGKDQVVIGFAAGEGHYTAIVRKNGLRSDNRLKSPIKHSYEEYFRASGLPSFILDLRKASKDEQGSGWLQRPHSFRSIGALAMDSQFASTDLCNLYDAIIYFDKTTASRSLPSR